MTCLLLSNCGLIGTALRLAPLALMLAENEKAAQAPSALAARGRQVAGAGKFTPNSRGIGDPMPRMASR